MKKFNPFLISFLFLLLLACQNKSANNLSDQSTAEVNEENELGEIVITVSGLAEAQPHFKNGLLLMHSFEYDDARAEFQKAIDIDSNFYMAYWGKAMTHNHPLWSRTNFEDAKEILNQLAPTTEKRLAAAPTEYEKELFEGAEILFGPGEKLERDDAYAVHMQKLNKKYPEDHEIASLYALSLLGSVDEGRDKATYEQGAAVAQSVLNKNPKHPGALHYLIHSYDDPEHAHKALFAADRYSKVAPDAEHALHMPSHIYIALGDWDNVINSNIASFNASKNKKEKKNLGNDKYGYHALHWLIYGHLQKGEFAQAEKLLREMEKISEGGDAPRIRSYRNMIEATYRTEVDDWSPSLVNLDSDIDDLNVAMQATNYFTQAKIALHNKDLKKCKSIIDSLSENRLAAQDQALKRGSKMCSGVGWYNQLPTQVEVNRAHIIEHQLRALVAMNEKDEISAEKWMQKASKLSEETSFMFGPPTVTKPAHEMYADWLLSKGRKEEAKVQYEKALERAPGRRLSTLGLKEAISAES